MHGAGPHRDRVMGHEAIGIVEAAGGPAPVRGYIEELSPDVLDGRIEDSPDGYRAMNDREAIKVMIEP